MKKQTRVALAVLVVLCAYLGCRGIHWGIPTARRFTPLSIDEYTPFLAMKNMHPGQLDLNPHYFNDPTFFYYQVGVAFQIASWLHLVKLSPDQGFYLTHPNEYAKLYVIGRAVVVAYAMMETIMMFLIGRHISKSDLGGLLTALFYVVCPLTVVSMHLIDVGIPVSFWLSATFYCLLRAINAEKEV